VLTHGALSYKALLYHLEGRMARLGIREKLTIRVLTGEMMMAIA
jgi:hypothetical protein